ncbi:MAG: hypothetical protein QXG39_08655 [Candidatus Aenigmatarchaeota archaeon]
MIFHPIIPSNILGRLTIYWYGLGRPRNSSCKSYQLLYTRFLKGPLWLEDWKSTGLKSRSTVHKRLKYLNSIGLIKKRREGHKILYELVPLQTDNGIITREGIIWHGLLHPLSRKEKRAIIRRFRNRAKEFAMVMDKSTLGLRFFAKLSREIDKFYDLPEFKEIAKILEDAGIKWKDFPEYNLLEHVFSKHLEGVLCLDCLREKKIVYLITDYERNEKVCPKCGSVIIEDEKIPL